MLGICIKRTDLFLCCSLRECACTDSKFIYYYYFLIIYVDFGLFAWKRHCFGISKLYPARSLGFLGNPSNQFVLSVHRKLFRVLKDSGWGWGVRIRVSEIGSERKWASERERVCTVLNASYFGPSVAHVGLWILIDIQGRVVRLCLLQYLN